MKKFLIGLLTGVVAVPALFFGITAIVAKKNDITLQQQLQQMVAEKVVDTEDETLEDEVIEDESSEENTETQE